LKKLFLLICLWAIAFFYVGAQSEIYSADELFEMALENSQALAEKTARERAARYRVKEARSKGAPSLSFESTMSYISNPDTLTVDAGALGVLDLSGLGGPISPMPAEDTVFTMSGNTYYDFKLIVDQPVFTWGKIYNALQATKEGAAAASIDSMKMRNLLKTEILINSLTLHYLKEIELAISKQSEIAARLKNIAEDSYNNGMILQTEFLESQEKLREAQLSKNIILEQINQVVLNLTYITGRELTPVMIETEDIDLISVNSWEEVNREAIENNSDLTMLRHSIKAEEYKTRIQKGKYYFKPDLAFHMELSYSGSYFPFIQPEWNEENKGNITLTLGIKAPIADFGGMYSAARAAEEELKATRASFEYNRKQIEKYIRQIIYAMELNKLNIDYFEGRIETDRQMIDQKEKEWRSGYGDESELLMQQVNYYSNIILLNQELIKQKSNYFKLKNITGSVNN